LPHFTPRYCGEFHHLGPAEFLDRGPWNLPLADLKRQVVIDPQLAVRDFASRLAVKLSNPSPVLISVTLTIQYLENWSLEEVFAPGGR
jgi:hypothetical protein